MSKAWRVAVLGATGLVGDTMITVLEERDFPVSELLPLASSRSLGKTVKFKGKNVPVIDVETFDFSRADIGLFSAGAEVSAKYAPIAAAAGCVVIDNTSQFRYDDEIPLVVPEVNPHAIAPVPQARHHREPELFDHPDAGGAEAAARCGGHRAHQRRDVSVRVRRRQGSGGRARDADGRAAERPPRGSEGHREADRLQLRAADRQVPWTTATPRKR